MKITKPLLCRNKREYGFRLRKLCNFCVYAGFLLLFICRVPLILEAEDTKAEAAPAITNDVTSTTENNAQGIESTETTDSENANNGDASAEPTTETITGTSKRMERYEKDGITILIDEAKTIRYDEQGIEIGFLNADKITLISDTETGTTTEVIAVGNVEIRDQDIFATCDHAIMNNLTNTVVLKENVVVLQNKDRLETKLFTFNRTTGKQTGEGGVKFKVTVTQAAPVETEADENTEGEAGADEADTATAVPEQTEGEVQEGTDAGTLNADGDTGAASDAGDGDVENTEPPRETNTNTEEDTDDADADAETEESENN